MRFSAELLDVGVAGLCSNTGTVWRSFFCVLPSTAELLMAWPWRGIWVAAASNADGGAGTDTCKQKSGKAINTPY